MYFLSIVCTVSVAAVADAGTLTAVTAAALWALTRVERCEGTWEPGVCFICANAQEEGAVLTWVSCLRRLVLGEVHYIPSDAVTELVGTPGVRLQSSCFSLQHCIT